MNCPQCQEVLHAYADDELDVVTAAAISRHLDECATCSSEFGTIRAIKAAASQPGLYYNAPAALREEILHPVGVAARKRSQLRIIPWIPSGIAAALFMAATLWVGMRGPVIAQTAADREEVLASHIRSLQPVHSLYDVASTDQHTVKPWFASHIDYAPPVRQLAAEGFPLEGGRLDYVHDRPVAALVYRHGLHVISLFVWPGESGAGADAERGINLLHWSSGGMTFWAASDVNAAELKHLRDLLLAPAASSN